MHCAQFVVLAMSVTLLKSPTSLVPTAMRLLIRNCTCHCCCLLYLSIVFVFGLFSFLYNSLTSHKEILYCPLLCSFRHNLITIFSSMPFSPLSPTSSQMSRFLTLCAEGDVTDVQRYVETCSNTDELVKDLGKGFTRACKRGSIALAEYVLGLLRSHLTINDSKGLFCRYWDDAFLTAGEDGNLEMAKWLFDRRPKDLTVPSQRFQNTGEFFTYACDRGQWEWARWFYAACSGNIIKDDINIVFYMAKAMETGTIADIEWVITWVDGTANDKGKARKLFFNSCAYGNQEVIRWLLSAESPLPPMQVEDVMQGFLRACLRPSRPQEAIALARWIYHSFPETPRTLQEYKETILECATKGGGRYSELAAWMDELYPEDFRNRSGLGEGMEAQTTA